jgi:hypothetical protein
VGTVCDVADDLYAHRCVRHRRRCRGGEVAFGYFRRQANAMEASLKPTQDGLVPQQRRRDDERQRDFLRDDAAA